MKYVGIDGCKIGWFSVSISGIYDWNVNTYSDISSLLTDTNNTSLVLMDVPIGLPYKTSRKCDTEARKLLMAPRASSVFPTPCREATRSTDYRRACSVNEKYLGVRLSKQSWNICNKIAEVDEFIIENKDSLNIRESHPEVCFWALAGGRPMKHNKKRKKGQEERLEILQSIYPESNNIYEKALSLYMRKEVARDDILDALVLAVTGFISDGQLESIPKVPEHDELGLPMEIVYINHSNNSFELLEFLKKAHDQLLEHSSKLIFDKKHLYHFNIIALYGSLLELTGCIIILIEQNGNVGIPSIFRTFLETYVEFHNLIKDPKYGYYMDASHIKESLKPLKEAEKGKNPYLKSISEIPNLKEMINEKEERLDELKVDGYTPLSIFQRFEKADMVDEYRSMYNQLSNDAHSNIGALINRHADVDMKQEDYEVIYYKGEPIESFLPEIDSSSGLLMDASIRIHELFQSEALEPVKELRDKLKEIRNK